MDENNVIELRREERETADRWDALEVMRGLGAVLEEEEDEHAARLDLVSWARGRGVRWGL